MKQRCWWVQYDAYASPGEPIFTRCKYVATEQGLCPAHIKYFKEQEQLRRLKEQYGFKKPLRRNTDEKLRKAQREAQTSGDPLAQEYYEWLLEKYGRAPEEVTYYDYLRFFDETD